MHTCLVSVCWLLCPAAMDPKAAAKPVQHDHISILHGTGVAMAERHRPFSLPAVWHTSLCGAHVFKYADHSLKHILEEGSFKDV